MRKFVCILLGLILFVGAGGILVKRQLQLTDYDGPSAAAPAATRSLAEKKADHPAIRQQRRINRGINQYRTPEGGWNMFQAALDVLNAVIGVIGIGMAFSGMRMRRNNGGSRT